MRALLLALCGTLAACGTTPTTQGEAPARVASQRAAQQPTAARAAPVTTEPTPPTIREERPTSRFAREQTIAMSVEGEPIGVRTFGRGPRRVLLIGLIHGNEPEGYEQFDRLWNHVLTSGLNADVTVHAIPNMNPEGYRRRDRYNARGVDLNRNWPASNFRASRRHGPEPLSEPESAGVHEHMLSFEPELVVVFHSTASGPFVDPDGPGSAETLARVFVEAAAAATDDRWRLRPDFTNPAGSLGTYMGLDQGVATLTVEFRRGQSPASATDAATAGMLAVLRWMSDRNAI